MRCSNCGNEIMNGSQFCQVCGAPAMSQAAQQPMQSEMNQGMYNQPYQQGYSQQNQVGAANAGWGLRILSFLIPIAGLILWLVKRDKNPAAAKDCLIWAASGVAVSIMLAII